MLGHSISKMTQHYAHVLDSSILKDMMNVRSHLIKKSLIMDRGVITISETGAVIIPTAPVWMTQFEIADLFRCSRATFARLFMLYIRIRS